MGACTVTQGIVDCYPDKKQPVTIDYTTDEIKKMSAEEINKNWDAVKASLNRKGD